MKRKRTIIIRYRVQIANGWYDCDIHYSSEEYLVVRVKGSDILVVTYPWRLERVVSM